MTDNRLIHQRIRAAIDALKLIDCDDIKSLDDDTLKAFYGAIAALSAYADIQIQLRHWARRDADEFERAVYLAPAECAQGGKSAEALRFTGDQPHCADPILSAIERIDEPHLLHGATHARRLRALADQAVIARQIDVRAWLYDLATLLEESA